MDEQSKAICEKTRKALESYVDYVQTKINNSICMAQTAGSTADDAVLCECIRTLNHVSGILLKLKEVENEESTKLTVHNSYVVNN